MPQKHDAKSSSERHKRSRRSFTLGCGSCPPFRGDVLHLIVSSPVMSQVTRSGLLGSIYTLYEIHSGEMGRDTGVLSPRCCALWVTS